MPDDDMNHAEKWATPPSLGAVLQGAGITARLIELPEQYLVSGNLAAFALASGQDVQGAGALGVAAGDSYGLRLARDRLLVVGSLAGAQPGWNAAGYAVSPTGAGLAVIVFEGRHLPDLIGRATTIDPAAPGPSAAVSFAGVLALLYRHGGTLRLHVERGLTAYLWRWLEAVFQEMPD